MAFYGTRRQPPGPGTGRSSRRTSRLRSGRLLLQLGASQHLCLRLLGGRYVWSGTLWKISAPSAVRADSRSSCAADGGKRYGHLADPGSPDGRAGYRSAQDLLLTCPSRSFTPEPQSAEQLVEVPIVLSPLRIAEQIVGIPVPLCRGQRRVQGFLPRQSSTELYSREERFS